MYERLDIIVLGFQLAAQIAVVVVLVWHGVSFSRQLKEARRDDMVRIRIQLWDLYIRYLNESSEVLKKNLRDQMSYLLTSHDQLSKHLKDSQEDEFLKLIRQESKRK